MTKEQDSAAWEAVLGEPETGQRTEEDGDTDVHARIDGAVEEVAPQRREVGGLAKSGEPLEVVRQPVDGDGLDLTFRLECRCHHQPDRKGEDHCHGERDQEEHRTCADAATLHVRPTRSGSDSSVARSSWPALCGPSTFFSRASAQDVDGRAKPGHDVKCQRAAGVAHRSLTRHGQPCAVHPRFSRAHRHKT